MPSTGLPVLPAPTRLVVLATRPSRVMLSTALVSAVVAVRSLLLRVLPTVCVWDILEWMQWLLMGFFRQAHQHGCQPAQVPACSLCYR